MKVLETLGQNNWLNQKVTPKIFCYNTGQVSMLGLFCYILGYSKNEECPSSHPFVLNNGYSCCKYYRKKDDVGVNPLCNGDFLNWSDPVSCCYNDEISVCPSTEQLCKNS